MSPAIVKAMLHRPIIAGLILAALICPALCGRAEAAEEPCCPHGEPAPAAPGEDGHRDDPCQIAPCFCGGSIMLPRDDLRAIRQLADAGLLLDEPWVAIHASSFEPDRAYWPSPPLPPDLLSTLPLLI